MTGEILQLGVTRQRILEAAGEVFAEQGFRAATVREICRRAEANVAAVNYHFGDKETLYAEVLKYAHACAMAHVPSAPAPDATPEQRLRGFVHAMVRGFLGEGRPAWHAKLMTREIAEPTGMLEVIVEGNVRPRFMLVKSIIQDLLGGRGTDDELRRCAWSVVGQCFFYRFGFPVLKRLHPPLKYDEAEIAQIADHIANFSLGAIKELAARKAKEAASS
jgi:TetR/AcrR family transcriptional regulator, regulator of cefoperazone and chloramphenicol sensitivity